MANVNDALNALTRKLIKRLDESDQRNYGNNREENYGMSFNMGNSINGQGNFRYDGDNCGNYGNERNRNYFARSNNNNYRNDRIKFQNNYNNSKSSYNNNYNHNFHNKNVFNNNHFHKKNRFNNNNFVKEKCRPRNNYNDTCSWCDRFGHHESYCEIKKRYLIKNPDKISQYSKCLDDRNFVETYYENDFKNENSKCKIENKNILIDKKISVEISDNIKIREEEKVIKKTDKKHERCEEYFVIFGIDNNQVEDERNKHVDETIDLGSEEILSEEDLIIFKNDDIQVEEEERNENVNDKVNETSNLDSEQILSADDFAIYGTDESCSQVKELEMLIDEDKGNVNDICTVEKYVNEPLDIHLSDNIDIEQIENENGNIGRKTDSDKLYTGKEFMNYTIMTNDKKKCKNSIRNKDKAIIKIKTKLSKAIIGLRSSFNKLHKHNLRKPPD